MRFFQETFFKRLGMDSYCTGTILFGDPPPPGGLPKSIFFSAGGYFQAWMVLKLIVPGGTWAALHGRRLCGERYSASPNNCSPTVYHHWVIVRVIIMDIVEEWGKQSRSVRRRTSKGLFVLEEDFLRFALGLRSFKSLVIGSFIISGSLSGSSSWSSSRSGANRVGA